MDVLAGILYWGLLLVLHLLASPFSSCFLLFSFTASFQFLLVVEFFGVESGWQAALRLCHRFSRLILQGCLFFSS